MGRRNPTDWWKTFFTGGYLDIQRRSRTADDSRIETDFIVRVLGLERGGRVLDVPCGTGRISIELALRRYQVSGIDITPEFLSDARAAAARYDLDIEWVNGDMRELPWKEEFDAAVCWFGSFGYFDDEQNQAFVDAVSRALKPGGRFLIDTLTLETLLPRFQSKAWDTFGNTLVLQQRTFNHETSRVETRVTIANPPDSVPDKPEDITVLIDVADLLQMDDEPSVHELLVANHFNSLRMYSYMDIRSMLERAGFTEFHAWGGLDDRPYAMGAERLYLVAVKG